MRRIPVILSLAMIWGGGLWLAPLSASAGVQIDVRIGIPVPPPPLPVVVVEPPPIVIEARPQLVLVPGSSVYYAPDLPYNYFVHAGTYYVFHDGRWFRAKTHHGPWAFVDVKRVPAPVLRVPVVYYRVPPGHHHRRGHADGHHKHHKHGKHHRD